MWPGRSTASSGRPLAAGGRVTIIGRAASPPVRSWPRDRRGSATEASCTARGVTTQTHLGKAILTPWQSTSNFVTPGARSWGRQAVERDRMDARWPAAVVSRAAGGGESGLGSHVGGAVMRKLLLLMVVAGLVTATATGAAAA